MRLFWLITILTFLSLGSLIRAETITVTGSNVNIRSGPEAEYKIIDSAKKRRGPEIHRYDRKDRLLETGDILINNFSKGQTKCFTAYKENLNYENVHRYRIEFDFGV